MYFYMRTYVSLSDALVLSNVTFLFKSHMMNSDEDTTDFLKVIEQWH